MIVLAIRIVRSGSSPTFYPLSFIFSGQANADLPLATTMTCTHVMGDYDFILAVQLYPDNRKPNISTTKLLPVLP
jgi:hypothetical protein